MYQLVLLLFITGLLSLTSTENVCSIYDKEKCKEREKLPEALEDLDDKYKEYYEAIKEAEDNYLDCKAKSCGCYNSVLSRDLKPFKDGINEDLINFSKSRGTLYQIIDKTLYRDKECMFPSRCAGVEHFLLKIIENMTDTEFIVNTRDYPQSSKFFKEALPVLSFSKTLDYYDIIYPAWSFWEGGPAISLYPRGLGRWDQHRSSLNEASNKNPWSKKENIGFFRGSRTSSERDNLILLSRKKPELVDARYTKNQAWKSKQDTLNESPASEVSLEDHCKYKYLFNYRGVAASFRHKHLFLCNSLVFHIGDEWLEFYYDAMKPWIHYVPVKSNASELELEKLIIFAKENDEIAKKIAQRGRDFVWYKLRMSDVNCYWKKLLKKYSKLLNYKPSLRKDLIKIGKK